MATEPSDPSYLGHRTWPEVDADRGADRRADRGADGVLVVVPIGSCEQHGPHLPIDTDTRIAQALADRLVRAAPALDGAQLLVAPALAITASGEHAGFPGTLSIGTAALTTVLVELVRSADWAAGVIAVNGHGGNLEALRAAVAQSSHEGRRVLAWSPSATGGDAHAGRTETSLLLAIAPSVVRSGSAVAGHTGPLHDLMPALRSGGVRAVSPNGVLGDPSGASAAEGHALLQHLCDDLVASVRAWWAARPTGAM